LVASSLCPDRSLSEKSFGGIKAAAYNLLTRGVAQLFGFVGSPPAGIRRSGSGGGGRP
jgi:hypothetical protein